MKYIKENLKEFETCNILLWHDLGYKGKGVKIVNFEQCNPESSAFDSKVHAPFGYTYSTIRNAHGNQTADIIHQVAPEADIYALSQAKSRSGNIISGKLVKETIPFMKENNICLGNISLSSVMFTALEEVFMSLKNYGITINVSSGNEGTDGLLQYAKSEAFLAIGAVGYNDWGAKFLDTIFLKHDSSRGPELDYTMFSGLYVHDLIENGRVYEVNGTSFSSPMFTGILALVQQFFLEKIGRTLWTDELILFINDYLIDLGTAGWDEKFGHGLFVLPHPNEIDIKKYLLRGQLSDSYHIDSGDIMKFSDVKKDRWSAADIDLVSKLDIMQGLPDGIFAPAKAVTREELATVIARLIREGYIKKYNTEVRYAKEL